MKLSTLTYLGTLKKTDIYMYKRLIRLNMGDKIDKILSLADELTLSQLVYVTSRLQVWCAINKEVKK